MILFALTWQLLFFLLINYSGLFRLPKIAKTTIKLAIIVSMIVGQILLNR